MEPSNQDLNVNNTQENILNEEPESLNNLGEDKITEKEHEDFSGLSSKELKQQIKKKNKELIDLNDEKEKAKTDLKEIVKNLNQLISNNPEILYHKEQDPIIIEQLERIVHLRERDLTTSRKINNTFKLQYKTMSERVETLLTPEKINSFESEIDNLRKQNTSMNSKIKTLKENNIENGKKIENLKDSKKYSQKIKSYTEEIKSLGSKKHDYYTKINLNKRSLENVIKEKEVLLKLYNGNIKEDSDEMIVSKINYWLDLIKSDLEGTEEEIIQKVETNNSKVIKEVDKNSKKKRIKNQLYLPPLNLNNINSEKERSLSAIKLKMNNKNKYNNKINYTQRIRKHQGIFSKYFLLKNKSQVKNQPRYMLSKNESNLNKDKNKLDELALDYESTSDNDYRELLSKKNDFVEMINHLQETMKEVKKISQRKSKDMTNAVSDNSRKLNLLQQQNLLIKNEIEYLENVYRLTLEQYKIQNELKLKEEEFIKMNNQININDANVTTNNNLEDLNDIKENIKENNDKDDRQKSIYQSGDLKRSKNDFSMEHIESNKRIFFPGDISKVEKIKEEDYPPYKKNDTLSREKRLEEIKIKYLDINEENEKQKENKNEEEKENDNNKEEENKNEEEKEKNNNEEEENKNEEEKEKNNNEEEENKNEEENENDNNEEEENKNEEENENENNEEEEIKNEEENENDNNEK